MINTRHLVDSKTHIEKDVVRFTREHRVTKTFAEDFLSSVSWRRTAVYVLVCWETGEFYIGSTANLYGRWQSHKTEWLCERKGPLYRLLGSNNYKSILVTAIECSDRDEAFQIEQLLIDEFFHHELCVNRYSNVKSPEGVGKGRIVTPEENQKRSVSLKKFFEDPEERKKISARMLGYRLTEQQSNIFKEANEARSIGIVIDGISYKSRREAARLTGMSRTTIKEKLKKGIYK